MEGQHVIKVSHHRVYVTQQALAALCGSLERSVAGEGMFIGPNWAAFYCEVAPQRFMDRHCIRAAETEEVARAIRQAFEASGRRGVVLIAHPGKGGSSERIKLVLRHEELHFRLAILAAQYATQHPDAPPLREQVHQVMLGSPFYQRAIDGLGSAYEFATVVERGEEAMVWVMAGQHRALELPDILVDMLVVAHWSALAEIVGQDALEVYRHAAPHVRRFAARLQESTAAARRQGRKSAREAATQEGS